MFVKIEDRPLSWEKEGVAPQKTKMSAAIRQGAKLRPKCTGQFFGKTWSWRKFRVVEGSCAIGAAGEIAFGRGNVSSTWFTEVPKFYGVPTQYAGIIWRMNDSGQTREQIADWLESQGY